MAFDDFSNKDCACDFYNNIGDFKTAFIGLLDGAIGILMTTKAALLLVPADFSDQLKKLELEAELTVIESTLITVDGPFMLIQAYLKPYSDCDGIQSVAKTINNVRNDILGPVDERKQEIEDLIEELNLEGTKIKKIDNWIEQLEAIKEAVELCGDI